MAARTPRQADEGVALRAVDTWRLEIRDGWSHVTIRTRVDLDRRCTPGIYIPHVDRHPRAQAVGHREGDGVPSAAVLSRLAHLPVIAAEGPSSIRRRTGRIDDGGGNGLTRRNRRRQGNHIRQIPGSNRRRGVGTHRHLFFEDALAIREHLNADVFRDRIAGFRIEENVDRRLDAGTADDVDRNGDGIINALDAALILQYDAGLIDSLPQ